MEESSSKTDVLKAWREKTKQQFNELYCYDQWTGKPKTEPTDNSKTKPGHELQQIRIPKDAERFYECSRNNSQGLVLINNEIRSQLDLKNQNSDSEFSGCFTLEFKKGLKQISHVVTVQSLHPIESTVESPSPIAYFEIKTLTIADKELKLFGIGLAGADYPIQKVVGAENSVGLRGDGKVFVDNAEKFNLNLSHIQNGSGLAFNLKGSQTNVGVGFIARTKTVFFTVNGKEVYQMTLPDCLLKKSKLYPSFSMGSLEDRVSVNFGEGRTPFVFDIKSKVNVSASGLTMLGLLQKHLQRDHASRLP